jgi:osmotically-inducible protein OsmY
MTFNGSLRLGTVPACASGRPDSERPDDEIALRARQRFEWSVQIPEDRIAARVQDGWVTLTGAVDWRYQRLAAASFVRAIHGVCGITNLITVRPQLHDADVREKAIDLAWTWQHGDGRAGADDRDKPSDGL